MNILIIEDVTTTGNSILQVANILRSEGLPVHKAITIVDRLAGASYHLALNSIELLTIFNKNDFII